MAKKGKLAEFIVEQFRLVQLKKKLKDLRDSSKGLEKYNMVCSPKDLPSTFIREVLIYEVHSTCVFSLAGVGFWSIFSPLAWGRSAACTSWRCT